MASRDAACERLGQAGLRLDHAHPAPAAARRRLDHQWKPDARGELLGRAIVDGLEPRHYRNAGARRQAARRDLVAERRHHVRRRSDENHPGVSATARANSGRSERKP